ncbi:S-adenosyl-L-methionine dependent methyltransferase [Piromyces finnis]|uniref:U6 small nuclear RNA (adenine-(43)-N(6))-methyltransferase n=1 Tax=Piromyces finnis TaxID=1754191 RepID=A0A1Y1VD85_9FUNG|nr:S-adenosyl-L-methionine dependent methyltransferase [Piromyces finnis]|eukprot:ORX52264.1 S-adenosyl-L-methionine dependent methyltransferase [Piromyces finnis]
MHQHNIYYNNEPDFIKLAESYSSLKKYIKFNRYSKQGSINFKDPRACRELTYALLWCDFKIRLEIPLDTLCPVIPGRLDYIHWIEDLIFSNDNKDANSNDNNNHNNINANLSVTGIDIGTGASCIYPLLACKLHPEWNFEALELNERSYEYAKDNVSRNNMINQIKVRRVKNEQKNVFSLLLKKKKKINCGSEWIESLFLTNNDSINNQTLYNNLLRQAIIQPDYTFCMCNPPFYSSEEEMKQSRELKVEAPHSVCTGSNNEMLTEGGEVQFIIKIIDDSVYLYKQRRKAIKKICKLMKSTNDSKHLQKKIYNKKLHKKGLLLQWYTSLIGKKKSIDPIVAYLKGIKHIKEIKTTNFKQGKTVRWGVAWSFKTPPL